MSSDDSDAGPESRRKRKVRGLVSDESPSSGSPVMGPRSSRRRRVTRLREDNSDSESDDSIVVKRKKIGRLTYDSEDSSSSDSVIVRRTKNVAPITEDSESQWESDFTDNDNDTKSNVEKPSSSIAEEKAIDSDSSDGQSEKCPICLVSFRLQEIGVPESCDHTFCLECIQEWSKNVNTCPIDRKEYVSISIKKSLDGVVDRKITVEKPEVQNEMDIVEDPTYCEICGSNDNEDRLLLCDGCGLHFHLRCVPDSTYSNPWNCNSCLDDPIFFSGCDLGFHLYCLTPPLQEVPDGAWFCSDCSPDDPLDSELHVDEIFRLLDEANMMFGRAVDLMNPGQRRARAARLLPRTTQVERVRRRIANNRRPTDVADAGPSTSNSRGRASRNITSSTSRPRPKKVKKRKKSKRTTISYKTVYEVDEVTGEAVAVKKRVKAKKRKSRSKRKTKDTNRASTSRRCRPDASNFDKNEHRRQNAGIPSLDLLGNTNRLDYFSDSDGEDYHNGVEEGIVLTRASNATAGLNTMRRVARRKGLLVDAPSTVSNASDVLGSILETQERFLSKNAVMTVVDSSGKLDIQQKGGVINHNNNIVNSASNLPKSKETKNLVSKKNNNVDINSSAFPVRETPYGGRRGGSSNRNRYSNHSNRGGGYNSGNSQNYHRRYDDPPTYSSNSGGGGPLDYSDNFDTSSGGFGRGRPFMRFGDGDYNTPQDYTRRTLLERENFDRPRRDENDDRNFPPPRFQDDYLRNDFHMPLEERENSNYPPRFQDNLNVSRRDRENSVHSPPRYDEDGESYQDNFNQSQKNNGNEDDSEPADTPSGLPTDFNSGPPPSFLGPPPNVFMSGPPPEIPLSLPSDFNPGLPPSFSGPPPNIFTPGPPPNFMSGPPPIFPSGPPPDFLLAPPSFAVDPPSTEANAPDFTSDSPPRETYLPSQSYTPENDSQENYSPPDSYMPEKDNYAPPENYMPEEDNYAPSDIPEENNYAPSDIPEKNNYAPSDIPKENNYAPSDIPKENNYAPPETYMPEEPYMPSESEDAHPSQGNNINDSNEFNPQDFQNEYNPEECTMGSDPEVDIYSDIEEEQPKASNASEGSMLPPPEPPISLLNTERPLTPSSVPYTPSRPLSPRIYSPKRPYSPPRSYSPSFPTSPPRTLGNEVPYTPSRPYSPSRTPERPSQADYPTTEALSPAENSGIEEDSENEMVIDTEKVQEEQKDETTPTTSGENLEKSEKNIEKLDAGDDMTDTDKQMLPDTHDETWEKDSDDGNKPKSGNMWDETPVVHKPKTNNWDETPVPVKPQSMWDETPANNWDETPLPRPKPPLKTNWDREEDELGDGCPNFSIYSRQSKSVALTTDLTISQAKENIKNWESHTPPKISPVKEVETTFGYGSDPRVKILTNTKILSCLYSDSEDESVVKKTSVLDKPKDLENDKMTEDIVSEEERSYTPCRDEKSTKQGLEGLDTEMVSEEERNEFEGTTADGDALEINAKDTELDFTRPEDCEEGEIFDKNKDKETEEEPGTPKEKGKKKKKEKDKIKDKSVGKDKSNNKENELKQSFKKISKSNKERNYRGDRVRSRSKSPKNKEKRKSSKEKNRDSKKKREKRKEIERYDVRAIISEKPERPKKDEFGRDVPVKSRSRSYTPPLVNRLFTSPVHRSLTPKRRTRSPSPRRRSTPRRRSARRRSRSRSRGRKREKSKRSRSRTPRSKSRGRKKDKPKNKKRKRSQSKAGEKRRDGKNKRRPRVRSKTHSPRPAATRDWTPSLSPSPIPMHMVSPSWTPPRTDPHLEDLRNQVNENLTVMLDNTTGGKNKRERRRKEKRRDRTSRRRRERTPPPSKEVFASGDNILVSVSFNNENETREIRDKRREEERKKKRSKRKDKNKEIANVKPVAIIDLDRSPFLEVPSSPKEVIVLSDSDQQDAEASNMETACDSSQQVASPEAINNYSTGPKTPPEPQVKFSLSTKPSQLRVISNPLHDPEDEMQEETQDELNNSMHKGPNTPPEPPTSPPSSPDAYDPFEPTKSRSATPEISQTLQSSVIDESHATNVDSSSLDITEKLHKTPEMAKSLTPPMADVQPADSQSSVAVSPQLKSPEQRAISNIVSQVIQSTVTTIKPVAQTTPFSSGPVSSLITSTPISGTITTQRINILNSTVISPSIPQRIVLPNQVKPSSVKITPTKATIKSTPIKPMVKMGKITKKVGRVLNGSSNDDITVDLDSPYSPASSDYEDLFEPPPDVVKAPKATSKLQQSHKSVFETLFGSTSVKKKAAVQKSSSTKKSGSKTKHIGVKIDEDSLKILEDLPNSAVEMQVKDKFLKKLNRQERVVEEVKLVLKPFYNKKKINKEEYKEVMRRAVPKICHNKTGEINPNKIRKLIEAYVKKLSHNKKVSSSSSLPLLK